MYLTSRRNVLVLLGILSFLSSLLTLPATAAGSGPAQEPYRPAVHFTPEKNWMNDPNGMVFHKGVYHLFFQHNPSGTSWGNMSWGHATSTDLLTWKEQPVAIEGSANEAIFSGSVVVDHGNTTGFGTVDDPALVAIYTSAYENHPTYGNRQAQSLAYSTDDGMTWTKYAGNPVLDRGSNNFRDPKVFWYDGGSPESSYWVMVAVEALDHKAVLYKSTNLKSWDFLSDFGPANATGGAWECPDLFELPVEGDPGAKKWVLTMNLNPGSVAGGSGGQYFVGGFDGTTFTSESAAQPSGTPPGEVVEDFERDSYAPWTVVNSGDGDQPGPFGTSPAAGAVPGQSPVTGFAGAKLLNSFRGGDSPVGTATSPAFEIDKPYVNVLVGGGNHPRTSDKLDNDPPAGDLLFDGFEMAANQHLDDFGWTGTGDLLPRTQPVTSGGEQYIGERRINTYEVAAGVDAGPTGDGRKGTLTSPEFQITRDNIAMLVGGGGRSASDPESLEVQLIVNGTVKRRLTGRNEGALNWAGWDVSDLKGQTAQLRIVDQAAGGWGHITLDHVVMTDDEVKPRSDETTVNLVVDGKVVRTATGNDSESLDWRSWSVGNLIGKQAQIRVVDNNRSGWGHVLVDQVMQSDTSATDVMQSYDWLDWGRDYYAAVSFSNTAGRRVMLGWMSNWDYAGQTPTSAWRSAMALPREVELAQTAKGPRLVQKVVREVADIERPAVYDHAGGVPTGEVVASQQVARIDTTLIPGGNGETGITVLGAGDTSTRIGYDADESRLFVDRRTSGDVGFSAKFASRDSAPVALHNGRLDLQIYIDKASVEVFTGDRRVTITDLVFPPEGADEIRAFAASDGSVDSMTVRPLERTMFRPPPADTTTSTAAAPSRLIVGQPRDVDVTVAGGDTVPTGSVSLERDGEALGDPVALDEEGRATVSLLGDEVGTTEFRVTYSGDKDHAASSAVLKLDVVRGASEIAIDDLPSDVRPGVAFDLGVVVSGEAATAPGGVVQLTKNGEPLGAPANIQGGVATLTVPAQEAGQHTFGISYAGDDKNAPTEHTFSVLVSKAKSSLWVSAPASKYFGQSTRITVNVPGATGDVRLKGVGPLQTKPLSSAGVVTFSLPADLKVGHYTMAVEYLGDASTAGAALSSPFSVVKGRTTTTYRNIVAPTSRTRGYGRVQVSPTMGGIKVDGSAEVRFTRKGHRAKLVRATVRDGVAKIVVPRLSKGTWTVQTTFRTDPRYVGSRSKAHAFTVKR